ncbi:glutathione synthetase-like [Watersipora subatra]|uniref:glutathione synthetase-like n=1 Tax=Watersipora subatra TaxID=2589382 RepID=UPI00355B355E
MADPVEMSPIDLAKKLDEEDFDELLHEFWDFSLYHGNQMKIHTDPEREPHKGHASSTSLVPTTFSRVAYERALAVQPLFNKLYHLVATDREFLISTIQSLRSHDEFMNRMAGLYQRLLDDNNLPVVYLALNRSDYLCQHNRETIKQVELNTIAAAASGVNRAATQWHRYVTGTLMGLDDGAIPENGATGLLAKAMVKSWELYSNPLSVIVILTVGSKEFNFADQRSLQYDIHNLNKRITVKRVPIGTLSPQNLKVDANKKLFINGREVALVYFRAGYTPKHYPNEMAWQMRYDIERSAAIKCPSLGYHLAGSKRVQQVLTKPGVLERWFDTESCQALRETFVGFHSFNKEEGGQETVALAREQFENFVMKPQRDGGGNNVYDTEIVDKVNSEKLEMLSAYTLMDKIFPPTNENYMVSSGNRPSITNVVSELGIFGAYIAQDGEVLMNESAGFLFRSKPIGRNEGDLMGGTSSLDSPWLVDS